MASHKVANAQFAFALYRHAAAAGEGKNIFFSPSSISTALAMLSLGAKSDTLGQMVAGLGFDPAQLPMKEIHAGFQRLMEVLNAPDSELQLSTGNALFIRQGIELLQTFMDDARNQYLSDTFSTDFQNEQAAVKQINDYVDKKTNGKIVDLLKSLDTATVLVLINYIYFRGQWEDPFEVKSTREADFHVDEHRTVKVPMMFNWGRYKYLFDQELPATVVQLPYKGNATALFILPENGKMKQLEDALSSTVITKWITSMKHCSPLDLSIPKFSISCTLDLKDILEKMGMTEMFSDRADLSAITGQCNLKVSKAVHQAVLTVDEKGTEAAAATALQAMPCCLPPTITFDRPFLFVIYQTTTESNLFIGKIMDPTAK